MRVMSSSEVPLFYYSNYGTLPDCSYIKMSYITDQLYTDYTAWRY